MKIHLEWIRVAAAAVASAAVVASAQPAAAQYAPYAPYRPTAQQPAAPVAQQQPVQTPYTPYTAYRTQAQYQTPATTYQPTPAAGQYGQPAAYGQYPQAAAQYPNAYGHYAYAGQPAPTPMPSPARPNESAAQAPAQLPAPTPANGSTSAAQGAPMNGSAAQPGCGCNGGPGYYGGGDYYTGAGCGCNGSYPNYGISNYFGGGCDDGCDDNEWFGGVYFLEMGRTNPSTVKLTSQMPTGGAYPYYPQPVATIMTNRDVDFDFREGVEVRFGSTFTVGESCDACNTGCNGYGYGYGGCNTCNTCGCGASPTTYAWEVAGWGINGDENIVYVDFNGTDRIYGMKSYVGLEHDRDGAGVTYAYRPVNDYYDYEMPIIDPTTATIPQGTAGYVRVVSQRVRTDFKAHNLELNLMRFPVCDTGCHGSACGCNGGCNGGGCDTCGCEESCGMSFSMYGSCGVRYFRVTDDFMYGTQSQVYDGAAYGPSQWLDHNIDVENSLVGPQVGWTTDYCWGKWNLFCNSTFGIFDNHASVWQRMRDEDGNWARFTQDGSNFNVRTSKDSVAFLGELRVGTAYEFTCHWRGVIAYRAVAISGIATADEQLQGNYADRYTVGLIDSDNSVIIHGAQVGAECRY
jgi:putative beta barrel porin BBP7